MTTTMMEPSISYVGLALVFLTPALGGFLFGYDIGATSFVLSMLRNDAPGTWWHDFSALKQGLFVAAVSLGALVGSHIVLCFLSTTIGRRAEIRLCAVLYLLGTLFNVTSGTLLRNSPTVVGYSCLILGRLIYGIGVGFIMHGAPAYMAEMCPPSVRGAVVTAKEAFIVIGILVGYACGYWLSDDANRWTDLYALTVLVTIPMLAMTLVIPRSKRWLLLKGRTEEAMESMRFVYRGDVRPQFETLRSSIVAVADDSYGTRKKPARLLDHRPALIASMGLIVFQQCSGQPSILSYTAVLFSAAGLQGSSSVATALYMISNSLFTVCMVDRVGRRSLLKGGCFLMMISLLALTVAFWGFEEPADDNHNAYFGKTTRVIILLSMFVYIGAYQIGFGPITWLIVSEVFPIDVRGQAIAFGVELNFLLNFMVQFLFPIVQNVVGWGGTFLGFACVMAFAISFVHRFVPETKGLTLEEIEANMLKEKEGIVLTEESQLLTKSDSRDEAVLSLVP